MDENYLDSLLNEFSLDNQLSDDIARESPRQDKQVELMADTFDNLVSQDSNTRLSADDDILGESQFDELDELDQMADMDMSDLDFSDLDFDDLDMLDTSPKPERQANYSASGAVDTAAGDMTAGAAEAASDNLSIDGMFFDHPADTEAADIPQASAADADIAQEAAPLEDIPMSQADDVNDALPLKDAQSEDMPQMSADMDVSAASLDDADMFSQNDPLGTDAGGSGDTNINDLLESLGIEDDKAVDLEDALNLLSGDQESANMDAILEDSVSDVEQAAAVKPKKSFAQFLFGPDEEDEPELSDEELAAMKAEKKAAKEAKKAEKKEKSDEKKAEKAAKDAAANADKAAKKAVKAAKKKEVLDNAPPEKKLNRTAVTVIMAFFAMVGAVIILGTDVFNYQLVIKKAANYFERQKYHMAYDEIAGVEVKDEDKELESKIYTVMYVERLYESYETNASLLRMDKALDSLLRGLMKYDEHYEEAQELNIVNDINYSRDKIVAALMSSYNLTEADAYAILEMDSYAYRAKLAEYAVDTGDITISLQSPGSGRNEPVSEEAADDNTDTEENTQVLNPSDIQVVDPE